MSPIYIEFYVFSCFPYVSLVSSCFSRFSPNSPCFPVSLFVFPDFAMFFYVSPWFSLFSRVLLRFPLFSRVFLCFPLFLPVFPWFSMFSYDSPCFPLFFYTFSPIFPCFFFLVWLAPIQQTFRFHWSTIKWCNEHEHAILQYILRLSPSHTYSRLISKEPNSNLLTSVPITFIGESFPPKQCGSIVH